MGDPIPNPYHQLRGAYGYSYSGYLRAKPPYAYAKSVPQLGAFLQQNPLSPPSFEQVEGFVLIGYVGWITFDGTPNLTGRGTSQVGGSKVALDADFTGTLSDLQFESGGPGDPPFLSGTFKTIDAADPSVGFTHKFVASSDRKTIFFTVTDGDYRDMVASGVMTKL
ncbi:MAG TPA: hypothetical protein VJ505_13470 [Holophagaceae bacterium]|nr:hypothetical protein [Holophagaceae bacterium]